MMFIWLFFRLYTNRVDAHRSARVRVCQVKKFVLNVFCSLVPCSFAFSFVCLRFQCVEKKIAYENEINSRVDVNVYRNGTVLEQLNQVLPCFMKSKTKTKDKNNKNG